jgi:hypothetical protein
LSFRYRIDAPHRRATIAVEGVVSPKAFGETMDKLFADPAYQPQFDIIYDRRAVQSQPHARNANQMVAYMVAHRDRLAGCRWAVVVAPEVEAAMASVAAEESVSALVGIEVRTFIRLEDANAWLDRDDGK